MGICHGSPGVNLYTVRSLQTLMDFTICSGILKHTTKENINLTAVVIFLWLYIDLISGDWYISMRWKLSSLKQPLDDTVHFLFAFESHWQNAVFWMQDTMQNHCLNNFFYFFYFLFSTKILKSVYFILLYDWNIFFYAWWFNCLIHFLFDASK